MKIEKAKEIIRKMYNESLVSKKMTVEFLESKLAVIEQKHIDNYEKQFGNENHNEETFAIAMWKRISSMNY